MTAQILTVKQQLYKIENHNFSVSNIQIIFKKKNTDFTIYEPFNVVSFFIIILLSAMILEQ